MAVIDNIGADDALSRLLSENRRFVAARSNEPTGPALIERRRSLGKGTKAVCCGSKLLRFPRPAFHGQWFLVRSAVF
jgi:hypothetical protein